LRHGLTYSINIRIIVTRLECQSRDNPRVARLFEYIYLSEKRGVSFIVKDCNGGEGSGDSLVDDDGVLKGCGVLICILPRSNIL